MSDTDIAEIKETIESRVEARFASGQPIYYLAQLGNDLGRDLLTRIEDVTGAKLSEFIGNHTKYDLIPTAKDAKVLYLRSPDAGDITPERMPEKKRYKLGFWTAFHKPATPEERRFVDLESGTFKSVTDDTLSVPPGHVEIDEDLLSEEDWPDDSDTARRVELWLQRHDIEEARFLHVPFQRTAASGNRRGDLLDEICDALSADQLRRTHLPLDVVATLRRN